MRLLAVLIFTVLCTSVQAQVHFITTRPTDNQLWVRSLPPDTVKCDIVLENGVFEGIRVTPKYFVISASEKLDRLNEKIIYAPYLFYVNGKSESVTPLAWLDKQFSDVTILRGSQQWRITPNWIQD